jgi:hypothetical protein
MSSNFCTNVPLLSPFLHVPLDPALQGVELHIEALLLVNAKKQPGPGSVRWVLETI